MQLYTHCFVEPFIEQPEGFDHLGSSIESMRDHLLRANLTAHQQPERDFEKSWDVSLCSPFLELTTTYATRLLDSSLFCPKAVSESNRKKPHTNVSSIRFVNQQPETCNDFYCEIKKEGVHPHERIVQHIVC